MNYLAHFHLSGNKEHLLLGNFIADAVKGTVLDAYQDDIQKGIRMHRSIDFYTDRHPFTCRSKDRLRAEFNHYSGVIVDVFYDHFLAKNWAEFSNESLPDYSNRIYSLLELHSGIFPDKCKHILPYMRRYDWLVSYAEVDGIGKVLSAMSKRVREGSKMELAQATLERDYELFEKDFRDFYSELLVHTEIFRE